jgi:hypothetical protein
MAYATWILPHWFAVCLVSEASGRGYLMEASYHVTR